MSMLKEASGPFHQQRISVKGKFLFDGDQKFFIKGTTYGTFRPTDDGMQFPVPEIVEKDFRLMARQGFNSVRTYTVPPAYLLDLALQFGLKVMVGLPWEQHITFLDNNNGAAIIRRIQEYAVSVNRHPAVLCYTIGNEIPAPIVRWYGNKRIERFIRQLYTAVKDADPKGLVTYVNFPTTEYLDLRFLDFDCFNVYLETPEQLSSYLARLHNLSEDRPLVMAEIGMDSMRNGQHRQAEVLTWQVETIFGKGCAGMFVFAWTDDWWRGGHDITDWDFGLVDRKRNPKASLHAVSQAMQSVPLGSKMRLPKISVVVCTYNGSATIRQCLETLLDLRYNNYEIIVVNDGSTDATEAIVRGYPVRLISTTNQGLSKARNTGLYQATGEIVAYIDDDAYPDEHWLHYLAYTYEHSRHACIGGPNIVPSDDGPVAICVANAPGGPVHVLISDEVAEHVPGCNMSFRKEALVKIGGFDPVYRSAGDDVDVCWRIQQAGETVGFHHSATVWHHRRNSFQAYWKQQKGYGKAEALLEEKWPDKYNTFGHISWAGRIYGNGTTLPIRIKKGKIFYGTWGTALFQSVYGPVTGTWNHISLMPEWYMLIAFFAVLSALSIFWHALLWVLPLFFLSVGIVLVQATTSAYQNSALPAARKKKFKYRVFIILLHIIQPMARLYGRLRYGLTPWRKKTKAPVRNGFILAFHRKIFNLWAENWRSAEDWLTDFETALIQSKIKVQRGGDFSPWDFQVGKGMSSINRALITIEEHGAGKQLIRMKVWTKIPGQVFITLVCLVLLNIATAVSHTLPAFIFTGAVIVVFVSSYVRSSAIAVSKLKHSFLTSCRGLAFVLDGTNGSPQYRAPAGNQHEAFQTKQA